MSGQTLPVAIIGAGPTGLAAAAHLVERGEIPVIFEMSEGVAGNIETWHHVRAFSRWADNIDPASRRLLEAQGGRPRTTISCRPVESSSISTSIPWLRPRRFDNTCTLEFE